MTPWTEGLALAAYAMFAIVDTPGAPDDAWRAAWVREVGGWYHPLVIAEARDYLQADDNGLLDDSGAKQRAIEELHVLVQLKELFQ